MPFSHRNRARIGLEAAADLPDMDTRDLIADKPLQLSSTRFHIIARVLVADRSRWLASGELTAPHLVAILTPKIAKRPLAHPDHTHQWMISIDSPSYVSHL